MKSWRKYFTRMPYIHHHRFVFNLNQNVDNRLPKLHIYPTLIEKCETYKQEKKILEFLMSFIQQKERKIGLLPMVFLLCSYETEIKERKIINSK